MHRAPTSIAGRGCRGAPWHTCPGLRVGGSCGCPGTLGRAPTRPVILGASPAPSRQFYFTPCRSMSWGCSDMRALQRCATRNEDACGRARLALCTPSGFPGDQRAAPAHTTGTQRRALTFV
ncbi:hypothetical protein NDU88_000458 [Pleurodeles waltl]|uniref:Uncharacterized protein n=1 Tax=Pleurodeles waltl TaxID=8319 RepID=A0AAV7V925_PLEWA|nr:hypothetical protein NDU88_000458 [Pleurodeles waltl]